MTVSTPEQMREIANRWIEEGWQKGDIRIVDELHSPDFVDHDSAGRSSDNEGFKGGITDLFTAFPDLKAQVTDLVVDASTGTVAVRWSATGTHNRPYLGAAPTGRSIRFKGIEIIRIRNNRINERWGEWDGIELLQQLGRLEL